MTQAETLIKVIKQQAEVFLLDAHEFYPFGTAIDKENNIIPLAAAIEAENDRPESQPLIDKLDNHILNGIKNGEYIIGGSAYDILMNKNQEKFDAMLIRVYENDRFVERFFKYYIHEDKVKFFEIEP